MSPRIFVWALAAMILTLSSRCRADHAEQIDGLVKPLVEGKGIVGCVVGFIDGDKQEVHGYGEVVKGKGKTPDGNTVYELGSVSKAFTGTLLADMIERGEVKLEQPISELLPEGITAPAFAPDQPITLMHLSTHTSGLPRLPDNLDLSDMSNPYAKYTPELMFAFLKNHKLRRAPGEYEYSNYATALLGNLLARRAGKPYEELLSERLTGPLKMNDTSIKLSADQIARLAAPYNASLDKEHNWDLPADAPAGGIRSTANDMLKLLAAALADDDRPQVKALHAAGVKHYGKPGEIGVGLNWHLARDNDTRWHNGMTGGYSSYVAYSPKYHLAVVVLCNTATDLSTSLGEKIIQSAAGATVEPVEFRKEVEVDAATLAKYPGVYVLVPGFAITVTLEDGRLMAQATGQSKAAIYASSPTEFFYRIVDAQISFHVGDDGKPDKLTLHQNGRDLVGLRAKP